MSNGDPERAAQVETVSLLNMIQHLIQTTSLRGRTDDSKSQLRSVPQLSLSK